MSAEVLKFKFKYVNENGDDEGVFSKKGQFDGNLLTLDGTEIAVEAVMRAESRFNRLILQLLMEDGAVAPLIITVTSGPREKLTRQLNAISSRRILDMRKEIAGDEGKPLNLRTMECPDCSAMLDITDFEDTQQMYCHYCDTIVTKRGQRPAGERKMSNCDECNYYAAPVKFTEFYFYFLVVIYGWRYNQRFMCHSCMRGVAWKMFFANLIFILGVPVAIIQLIRSYKGGGPFAGLDRANHHAKKKRLGDAIRLYRELDKQHKNAGVSYNMALANLAAGKNTEAIAMLEKSLSECSNYAPAYALLREQYKNNNEIVKLKALQKIWGDDDEDAADTPSDSIVADKPVLDIGT